jgi:flagellar motor switch protein FliM
MGLDQVMTGGQSESVLRRLAQAARPAEPAVTPARALRMAMIRAAERSSGLALGIVSVTDETASLDGLLRAIEPDLMLISLARDSLVSGLVGVDLELRTALIEVQTMGRLGRQAAESRPITATDAALSLPLIAALIAELSQDTGETDAASWASGHHPEGRINSLRAAEMMLPDAEYRLVRIAVALGSGDRRGALLLAIATARTATAGTATTGPRFADALRANVMAAQAELNAVLHRLHLPLFTAEGLAVGQVLSLPGVTVTSVRLEGPDGRMVGRGRLGQSAGLRAIRMEAARPHDMTETDGRRGRMMPATRIAEPAMQIAPSWVEAATDAGGGDETERMESLPVPL